MEKLKKFEDFQMMPGERVDLQPELRKEISPEIADRFKELISMTKDMTVDQFGQILHGIINNPNDATEFIKFMEKTEDAYNTTVLAKKTASTLN